MVWRGVAENELDRALQRGTGKTFEPELDLYFGIESEFFSWNWNSFLFLELKPYLDIHFLNFVLVAEEVEEGLKPP